MERLHLTTDGLAVGEWYQNASGCIAVWAAPSSPADHGDLPTAGDLGLDLDTDGHTDCSDCPHLFSVAADGETFGWIEWTLGTDDYHYVVRSLDGETDERHRFDTSVPAAENEFVSLSNNVHGDSDLVLNEPTVTNIADTLMATI